MAGRKGMGEGRKGVGVAVVGVGEGWWWQQVGNKPKIKQE